MDGVAQTSRFSKLMFTGITALLTFGVSFNVWVVNSVHDRPTGPEIQEMIKSRSPYVADRNMILYQLKVIHEDILELKTMVKNR